MCPLHLTSENSWLLQPAVLRSPAVGWHLLPTPIPHPAFSQAGRHSSSGSLHKETRREFSSHLALALGLRYSDASVTSLPSGHF